MKASIKNIFTHITLFLSLSVIISAVAVLFSIEQTNSFTKIDILNEQKNIISTLKEIDKADLELALIQFNGKSTQLQHQVQKLRSLYEYDIMGNYILNNSSEYFSNLDTLSVLIETYNSSAYKYYKSNLEHEATLNLAFSTSFLNINNHISKIIFANIEYDRAKLIILQKLAFAAFILMFIFAIWYYKQLKKVYKDILFLYSLGIENKNYEIFSQEADAIYLRMKRKPEKNSNPVNLDPITGINNNKGLVSSYSDKKGLKESDSTFVTVLEVDNFSKTNRAFPTDFTQAVLKKIAYTISLYEQATDVIARSDYNQFTVILSRANKDKAFKEMEQICQSISELKFVTATKTSIVITISGGFFIKPNNLSLEIAMQHSKEILKFAKENNGNKISKKSDVEGLNF